ncbi:serine hydrolase [Flavihumibacter sp. R14]|nr:serine hydrolase [Flavihumibacter soli]
MKTTNFRTLFHCCLLLFPALADAQTIADKADSLLSAYHKQDLFTGTVIIARRGKVLFERSYGMANRDAGMPNASGTQYRIGSLSKPVTAIIMMQLREKGMLKFSDPLSKYLPGFTKGDSVTVEDLLNHTSGIRSLTSTARYRTDRMGIKGQADVLEILRAEPFAFSPGSSWQYSNSNYMLLSYIAEKVSGRSMSELVSELAKKQGLKKTGMDYDGRTDRNKAVGYEAGALQDYVPVADNNVLIITGAGGIYSTATDLLKLDRALYSKGILSRESKQDMFRARKGDYALGWETGAYKNRIELGHSGSIEGFKAMMLRYPESETTIIFLSNYWNTPGPAICESLKAISFGEPYKMPEARSFISFSAEQLKAYEGDYSFNGAMTMNLSSESGVLLSTIKGQPVVGFKPMTDTDFFNKSNNALIKFIRESDGTVGSFKLVKGQQVMEWKRLKAGKQ